MNAYIFMRIATMHILLVACNQTTSSLSNVIETFASVNKHRKMKLCPVYQVPPYESNFSFASMNFNKIDSFEHIVYS